jgi:hypothetical protein
MALGRKTGGRKPGSLNIRTKVAQQALLVAATAEGSESIDAIELLQRVYRSTEVPLFVRIDCAKAALKHETPTLSSVEQKHEHTDRTTRIEVVYVDRQPAVSAAIAHDDGQG